MYVVICGGRDYRLTADDIAWLDALHREHGFREVIDGGATGADEQAYHWAQEREIPTFTFTADWDTEGRAAGPRRNTRMLAYLQTQAAAAQAPCAVLAFPGGRGTADLCRQAERAGVPVWHAPTVHSLTREEVHHAP